MTTPPPPVEVTPLAPSGGAPAPRRAVVAAAVGNLLEWFDFSVYALFAIYIGRNFFPSGAAGVELIRAFLVFGFGFVVRPLGSVLLGAYGDRAGRKAALTGTVLLMGVGTLVIAAAPPYAAIGFWAPLLLVVGRLLQGFSAGGEIGSAAAFLVEQAPEGRTAASTAWLQASMGMSNIVGALVAVGATTLLSEQALFQWGWRIPFIIGLAIVPLGWYLRSTLAETPAFTAESSRPAPGGASLPMLVILREDGAALAIGFGISILWAVAVYVLLIFMPVFVQKSLGFSAAQAFGASLLENAVFVTGCFCFGAIADRIGPARLLGAGALALGLGVPPLFLWLDTARTLPVLVVVLGGFGLQVAAFTSVAPTVLAWLFPIDRRATGISITYNAAFTIFGGFAPAILTWFTATAAGSVLAPAWYVAAASIPALAASAFLRPRGMRPRQVQAAPILPPVGDAE